MIRWTWHGLMLRRHGEQRGSEGEIGGILVPAPSKGGEMSTKHSEKSRFHLNRAACLRTMAD